MKTIIIAGYWQVFFIWEFVPEIGFGHYAAAMHRYISSYNQSRDLIILRITSLKAMY